MKKKLVCQSELDHKIWGAVSVVITRSNKAYSLKLPEA
jgi:hypothetical protein